MNKSLGRQTLKVSIVDALSKKELWYFYDDTMANDGDGVVAMKLLMKNVHKYVKSHHKGAVIPLSILDTFINRGINYFKHQPQKYCYDGTKIHSHGIDSLKSLLFEVYYYIDMVAR